MAALKSKCGLPVTGLEVALVTLSFMMLCCRQQNRNTQQKFPKVGSTSMVSVLEHVEYRN